MKKMTTQTTMRGILFFFLAFAFQLSFAADFYWVGGPGNWSDHGNHWATATGGSIYHNQVPSPLDNVIFDGNSFTGSNQQVLADVDMFCNNMTWHSTISSGAILHMNNKILTVGNDLLVQGGVKLQSGNTININGSFLATPSVNAYVYNGNWYLKGSLEINSNVTWSTGWLNLVGTTTGNTIKLNGNAISYLKLNGLGGEWTCLDGLKVVQETQLYKGTLKTGGFNTQLGWRMYANYSDANFTFNATGTDTITVGREWNVYNNLANINLVMDQSTLVMTETGHQHLNFNGGSKTYHNLVINHTHPTSSHSLEIYHNNTFNDVTVNMGGNQTLRFRNPSTYNDVVINMTYDGTSQTWQPLTYMWSGNTLNSLSMYHPTVKINPRMYLYGTNTLGDITIGGGWNEFLVQNGQTANFTSLAVIPSCKRMPTIGSTHTTATANFVDASGTNTLDGVIIRAAVASGGATFNVTNTVDKGYNTGWNFGAIGGNDYYWIGGTGNWNDLNHWSTTSGGTATTCLPRAIDNVHFDANSFSVANSQVNLNVHVEVNNMTWTSGVVGNPKLYGGYQLIFNGDVALNGTMVFQQWHNLFLYGSISVDPAVDWIQGGNTYLQGSGTNTMDMNGHPFGANLYVRAPGATWTLQSKMAMKNGRECYWENGTMVSNGNQMNFGRRLYAWYNSANNNMTLDLAGTDSVWVDFRWEIYPNQYMNVINAENTAMIMDEYNAGDHMYFRGGIHRYGDLVMKHMATNSTHTMYVDYQDTLNDVTFYGADRQNFYVANSNAEMHNVTASWGNTNYNGTPYLQLYPKSVNNVSVSNPSNKVNFYSAHTNANWNKVTLGSNISLNLYNNHTLNVDSLIANGSCDGPIYIQSRSAGNTATLNMDANSYQDLNYVYVKDVIATGGATFVANDAQDLGNNTGWTLNEFAAKKLYWVGGTGNWTDASHWSLTSGGTGQICAPTLNDTVIFDSNSFTSSGGTVTLDNESTVGVMYWESDVKGNPNFNGGNHFTVKKLLALDGTMSFSLTQYLYLNGSFRSNQNVTWNHTNWAYLNSDSTNNFLDLKGMFWQSTMKFDRLTTNNNSIIPEWDVLSELNVSEHRQFYFVRGKLTSNGNKLNFGYGLNSWDYGAYNNPRTFDFTGTDTVFVRNRMYVHPNNVTWALDSDIALQLSNNYWESLYLYFGNSTWGSVDIDWTYPYHYWGYVNFNYYQQLGDVTINLAEGFAGPAHAGRIIQLDGGIAGTSGYSINNLEVNSGAKETRLYTRSNKLWKNIKTSNSLQGWFRWWAEPLIADTVTIASGSEVYLYNTVVADSVIFDVDCQDPSLLTGGTLSVASGTIDGDYVSLTNTVATGGATFNASNSTVTGTVTGWNIQSVPDYNLYWVGGYGDWTDPDHWAFTSGGAGNGCVYPGENDNAIFDANSFTASSKNVRVYTQTVHCKNMIWKNQTVMPVFEGNQQVRVHGDVAVVSPMQWSQYGELWIDGSIEIATGALFYHSGWMRFVGTGTGNTIDINHNVRSYIQFNGVGEWELASNLKMEPGWDRNIYFERGTFKSNGFDLNVSRRAYGHYNNGATVDLSNSNVTCEHYWYFPNSNTTVIANNSTIEMNAHHGLNFHFYGGGHTWDDVVFNHDVNGNYSINIEDGGSTFGNVDFNPYIQKQIFLKGNNTYNSVNLSVNNNNQSTTTNVTVSGSNTFGNFTLLSPGTAGPYLYFNENNTFGSFASAGRGTRVYLGSGKTQTANSFTLLGTGSQPAFLYATTAGTQATLNKATGDVCFDFVWLQDINATGSANFNAGASSQDLGNNTNWNFASCVGYYWVDGSGNWSDTSHWATSSGGQLHHIAPPTKFDNVYFDANSFLSSNQTVTIDVTNPACYDMNWQSAFFNPTLVSTSATSIDVHGSLTLTPNMSMNFTGLWNLKGHVNDLTVNAASQTLSDVSFVGPGTTSAGGTWTLTNDLNASGTISVQKGSLTTDDYSINTDVFDISTAETKAIDLGNSEISIGTAWNALDVSAITFNSGLSEITFQGTNSVTFNGGGLTYNDVLFETPSTMAASINDANTFNNLFFGEGLTVTLESGVTQTMSQLDATASCNNNVTINASVVGTAATMSQASGTVDANFINLEDNTATGGASFEANLSVNNGNVSGWVFNSAPILSVAVTSVNASCPAPVNGSASATIIGGKSPFTYDWSSFETTASISNLTPGSYSVEVTDSNGCVAADTIVITQPASFGFTASSTGSTICNSATDGSISAIVDTLGLAPFTYAWDNGATTATVNSLTAGAYNVTVTDADNCETTVGALVSEGAVITVNPTAGANNCMGYVTTFSATSNGGAGAMTFDWDFSDGNIASGNSVSNTFAQIGTYMVYVTATDANGCSSLDSVSVSMVGCNQAPIAVCSNITLNANSLGTASITYVDINGGSSDPDGDLMTFTVSNSGPFTLGTHSVTLTVTDPSSATSSCNALVTVLDVLPPTVIAQNVTVQLDALGNGTTTASAVNNGSSDPSGIANMSLDISSFTCTNVGSNPVTLTVTDNSGNVSTASALVNVVDANSPNAICQNASINLDANGQADIFNTNTISTLFTEDWESQANVFGGSTLDNWNVTGNVDVLGAAASTYPILTSRWIDMDGNFSNGTIETKSTFALTAGSTYLLVFEHSSNQYNNSLDNQIQVHIGGYSETFTPPNDFLITNFKHGILYTPSANETVTLKFQSLGTASSGGSVLDNISFKKVTGNLLIDNGSNATCGVNAISALKTCFSCSDIGANSIPMVVTGYNGLTSTCTATVNVADGVAPTAVANDTTIYLDANGNASLTAAELDNGSADNCGLASLAIDRTTFSCTDTEVQSSLYFDGSLDKVTVPANSALNFNTGTVEAWVKPGASSTNRAVLAMRTTVSNTRWSIHLNESANSMGLYNGSAYTTFSYNFVPGTWYHVAVSFTGSATVFYINGVQAHSMTTQINTSVTNTPFAVGSPNDPGYLHEDFIGEMDEVRVWNVVRTAAQILSSKDSGLAGTETGLVTYLPFNENTGNTSSDESTNGFTATINGAVWNTQNSPVSSSPIVTLTVTDNNGNVSTATSTVTVLDNLPPVMATNSINVDLVSRNAYTLTQTEIDQLGANSSDNCEVNFTISSHSIDCSTVGQNLSLTLTGTDASGNSSSVPVTVSVTDLTSVCNDPPVAVCQNITIFAGANCNAMITANDIDGGSTDPDGDVITYSVNNSGPFVVGTHNVILTVSDGEYSDNCSATITVLDNTVPVAIAQNVTVQLDASGNGSITTGDIDNGSNDACGIASLSLDNMSFTCANVGANTVTLTVTDNNGNVSTATATVTVEDNVNPVAIVQNVTVQLDASGNGSITTGDIDNGSNDACGIASLSLDNMSFTCANVGVNTVTLTVTDDNGNVSTATATVTVVDNIAPGNGISVSYNAPAAAITNVTEASDYNVVYKLDIPNTANWDSPSQIAYAVNNSAALANIPLDRIAYYMVLDNKWVWVSMDAFTTDPSTLGIPTGSSKFQQTVSNMNVYSSSNAGVTNGLGITTGNIEMWADCYIGTSGLAGIGGDNNNYDYNDNSNGSINCYGSFQVHNWGAQQTLLGFNRWSGGGTSDLGIGNQVGGSGHKDWTFAGNANTYTTKQLYILVKSGNSIAQDTVVFLDAIGQASITNSQVINPSATDNCGIASSSVSQTSFSCADLGVNTVNVSLTDVNSNTSTTTATVTVIDNLAPVMATNSINVDLVSRNAYTLTQLEIDQLGANSSDNCEVAFTISSHTIDCSTVGQTINLTLTGTDPSGNTSSVPVTVSVTDLTSVCNDPPVAICQNITIYSGANCNAMITANDIDGGSTDPDGDVLTYSVNNSGPFVVGTHNVILTVSDGEYSDNCSATITVLDNTVPVAIAQNVTVQLDASGNGSITTGDIDNGSNDACGIASLSLDNMSFTCANVGANTVTLTVIDNNGNVSTATATVTIEDNVNPIAIAQNVTVQLDASGNGSITTTDIDNGSSDACGVASLSLDNMSFTCANVGANTVTLTVTDNNGNVSTATATVTIEDNVNPVAVAQNVTVQLDASGNGSITTTDIDNGSSDACGVASLSLDNMSFTCANVGANTVTLTVTDNNGNVSTATATVTVEDNVNPVAVAQNVTVQLDASGNGSTSVSAVNNGSSDACGIDSMSLSNTVFTCADVGSPSSYLQFNNSNAYTNIPSGTLPETNFTLEYWFKTTASNANLFEVNYNGHDRNMYLNNGSLRARLWSDQTITSSASGLNDGVWHHVSWTVQSGVGQKLYVDGALVATGSKGESNFNWAARFYLGYTVYGGANTGSMDEFRLWNRVVPVSEMTTNRNQSLTGNEPGLLVYYDFEPSTGTGSYADKASLGGSNNISVQNATSINGTGGPFGGGNIVTLTVTDNNGNVSTASAMVTVLDNVAPVAVAQNVTVQLDASGNGSTTAALVNNGSSDACGIASMTINNASFTCANVGSNNPVTLTVTDVNGNVSTASAMVTVEDNVAPVAVAQNVTVQLDASGNGSTTATLVNNGSNDACGIASMTINNATFTCANVGSNNPVTITVTDVNGNVSTASAMVTVEDNVAPVAVAQNVTVQLDASGNGSTTATLVNNGSSDACGIATMTINNATFTCANVGSNNPVTLTVTDVNGNVSTASAMVTVEDNVAPVAVAQNVTVQLDASGNGSTTATLVNNGSSDACGIATMTINNASFTCANVGSNNPVTLTVTDVNGNVSTASAMVTVEDNVNPVAVAQNVTVQLDASGNGSTTATLVNNGSSDACGIATMTINNATFTCANVGSNNPVTLTVTDVNGNVSTASAMVTVEDNVAPVAVAQNVTVQLDASGNGSTTAALVNNGSNDACGIASMTINNASFTCANVGSNNPVTLTVTDVNGNVSTASAMVTVEDNVAPVAVAQNVTVQLDASGNGSTTAALVNNGSNDACGIASMTINNASFTCANVGSNNPVTLTVTDVNGNVSTSSAMVTVEDNVNPVAVAQNVTVQLDASGNGSTTAALVNNGSSDACGIASMTINNASFTCANVGSNNPVTLTVTDVNGNVSTASAMVTVEDNVNPVAVAQNVTVQLDASGNGSTTAALVNNGSSDACGIASMTINNASFTCANVGSNNPVTLTVTDVNGNVSTASAMVTVEDNVAPVAVAQNVTVQLDASGNGSTTAALVNNGSNDACGIATMTINNASFTCANVGSNNPVTLTVTDNNGNVSTASAMVTVEDNVVPVAVAQNVTVQLDASGNGSTTAALVNNGSNDACGIASMTINNASFTCANVGSNNPVTLTVTDVNGNVSTASAMVTVEDNVNPVAVAQNVTVQLDASGNGSTTAALVNNGSNDACGIASMTINNASFTCANVGSNNPVTLTVTDVNGNVSTASAMVTVEDNVNPVAVAQNVTVQLDASGNGSTTAALVNNGSNDACGIASMTINNASFTCANVGSNNPVTLTVTDVNGNVSTASATVTVEDNVDPITIGQDLIVQLDSSGFVSITAQDVDNGSNDACGIAVLMIDNDAFDCSNVGANTVVLASIDTHGNSTTDTVTVTVEDNVAPVAICRPLSVTLVNGTVSITSDSLDDGSYDACGIASMTISDSTWSCTDLGNHEVTLTVTDVNGNVSTCTSTVTVIGAIPTLNIASAPTCNVYTGGDSSIIYLGYGSQTTVLATTVTGGSVFTYAWTGPAGLDSNSLANPTFTPTIEGYFTFTCVVTNEFGCDVTSSITICVRDIRVPCTKSGHGKHSCKHKCNKGHKKNKAHGHKHGCSHTCSPTPPTPTVAATCIPVQSTCTHSCNKGHHHGHHHGHKHGCSHTCGSHGNGHGHGHGHGHGNGHKCDQKVYLSHLSHHGNGHHGHGHTAKTIKVKINAVAAHLANHSSDELGKVGESCSDFNSSAKNGDLVSEEFEGNTIDVLLYPNPSINDFTVVVESEMDELVTVEVFDLAGNLVQRVEGQFTYSEIVMGQDLAAGVYLVVVQQGEFRTVLRAAKGN